MWYQYEWKIKIPTNLAKLFMIDIRLCFHILVRIIYRQQEPYCSKDRIRVFVHGYQTYWQRVSNSKYVDVRKRSIDLSVQSSVIKDFNLLSGSEIITFIIRIGNQVMLVFFEQNNEQAIFLEHLGTNIDFYSLY